MSIPHAKPGEVVSVRPFNERIGELKTHTLVKTGELEVLRLVLLAGKVIPEHQAPSEITVQCLEGRVAFTAKKETVTLSPGDLLFLGPCEPHSLRAEVDSSLLVTLLLRKPRSDTPC